MTESELLELNRRFVAGEIQVPGSPPVDTLDKLVAAIDEQRYVLSRIRSIGEWSETPNGHAGDELRKLCEIATALHVTRAAGLSPANKITHDVYWEALGKLSDLVAGMNSPIGPTGTGTADAPRRKSKPGRKPQFDAKADAKSYENFRASGFKSVKEFAREKGMNARQLERAFSRCRARKSRARKSRTNSPV